jgi:16S rRNA (guanine966-N2)-methyltransferase
MAVKVIAGLYRGRVLRSVPGQGTRPLLSQVRAAVFNILAPRLEGAVVWDLFAGTGASGIEALSRGAARVWFLEKSNRALSILRANLAELGEDAGQRSRVVRADAWEPPPLGGEGAAVEPPPDVVFLDPPYATVIEDPTRAASRAQRLADRLAPGGILAFHFPEGLFEATDFDRHRGVRIRDWGRSGFAFLSAAGS